MRVGLALSGGGVKAAAHIGVLQALKENGIEPYVVAGTSAGSMVAVLYAMGYTPEEMFKLFDYFSKLVVEADPRFYISSMKENKKISGLLSGENIEKAVSQACEYKNIKMVNELKVPFSAPAVDAIDGKEYIFTNMPENEKYHISQIEIAKAVRASCSFPAIYAPLKWNGHHFLDGGILDNVPAKEARRLGADKVISVTFPPNEQYKGYSIYSILLRTLDVMTNEIANINLQTSDYILALNTGRTSLLGIDKLEHCYKVGYEEALKRIDEIKRKLS